MFENKPNLTIMSFCCCLHDWEAKFCNHSSHSKAKLSPPFCGTHTVNASLGSAPPHAQHVTLGQSCFYRVILVHGEHLSQPRFQPQRPPHWTPAVLLTWLLKYFPPGKWHSSTLPSFLFSIFTSACLNQSINTLETWEDPLRKMRRNTSFLCFRDKTIC